MRQPRFAAIQIDSPAATSADLVKRLKSESRNAGGLMKDTWDAALEKQLRPLALHFGVKRQRGRTLRMSQKL